MLYAIRNQAGQITSLTDRLTPEGQAVNPTDPEVLAFLSLDESSFTGKDFLDESDLPTIRILEDLIDTLIDQQVIRFTDLPDAAERKLLSRKVARSIAYPDGKGEPDDQNQAAPPIFLKEEDQLF